MKSFSSQEEAGLYNIKKRLQKTYMERLQTLCRIIRIGKMLPGAIPQDNFNPLLWIYWMRIY